MTYEGARSAGAGAFLAGVCTGATYTAVIYPIEAARTQLVTGVWPLRFTYRGSGFFFARMVLATAFVQYFFEAILGRPIGLHGRSNQRIPAET